MVDLFVLVGCFILYPSGKAHKGGEDNGADVTVEADSEGADPDPTLACIHREWSGILYLIHWEQPPGILRDDQLQWGTPDHQERRQLPG